MPVTEKQVAWIIEQLTSSLAAAARPPSCLQAMQQVAAAVVVSIGTSAAVLQWRASRFRCTESKQGSACRLRAGPRESGPWEPGGKTLCRYATFDKEQL